MGSSLAEAYRDARVLYCERQLQPFIGHESAREGALVRDGIAVGHCGTLDLELYRNHHVERAETKRRVCGVSYLSIRPLESPPQRLGHPLQTVKFRRHGLVPVRHGPHPGQELIVARLGHGGGSVSCDVWHVKVGDGGLEASGRRRGRDARTPPGASQSDVVREVCQYRWRFRPSPFCGHRR